VPGFKPVAVAVFCGGAVFHVYEYPGVPPDALTLAVPLADDAHEALVELELRFNPLGSVNVTDAVATQPAASVTVTVYVPDDKPVAIGEVCGGTVLQAYE
jgi:hypothetical protein